MNRSGFASCPHPITTSRSRFLRKMGQVGQLMHHEEEAGDGAAVSQACLPRLVPLLLEKPVLEANLDERSISKEGPGPSARDPARRAPAPIRGQGTEKGSEESSLLISFDCAEEQ